MADHANTTTRAARLSHVGTRADGSRVDLGTVAYYPGSSWRMAAWRLIGQSGR